MMSEQVQLSKRQESILKYIATCMETDSRPPTIREIGGELKISSTSVVNYNLNRLRDKGLLDRDPEVSRGLRLTDAGRSFLGLVNDKVADAQAAVADAMASLVRIPLLGTIVAGEPIDVGHDTFAVYDDEDMVELSSSMIGGRTDDLYALRVNGDSMIDDMVNDGDIVIIRQQETAKNGEMIAAWVDGEGTTLKRIYVEGQQVRLQPANPTMEPIYVDSEAVQVQGKVMMVLRQTA